jgi:diacylglycerol kinase family enzyme
MSTRLAAWLALVAAAGVISSLVVLLAGNVLVVVAALLALALAAAAGWIAATHRGALRALAAATAVLALAAATATLVVESGLVALAVLALSLALFAYALRHAFDDVPIRSARAPARSRRLLLINPRSGGGRAASAELETEAARRGIETIVLAPGDDLHALAERAAGRVDVLGVAGGDGSQALVAAAASARDVAFVCVPAGTRNHLARDLGIDAADLVASLDAFDADAEIRVDLADVNGRTFVNNVSLGVYAELVRDDGYRAAKLATARRRLPALLADDACVILVSNNPYELEHLVGLGERLRLDGGELGIVTIEVADAADAAALASLHAAGQVRRFRGWRQWTAATFRVDGEAPIAAGIDGESVLLDPPLEFAARPRALRVLLPPGAEQRAAVRARSHRQPREVLDDLWHVAASPSPGRGDEALRGR